MDDELILDGNAAAGVLAAIFGTDVSGGDSRCAHCGTVSVVATFRAYTRGPGTVLRCPNCGGVVVRVAEIAGRYVVDARGVAALRIDA
ncbi:MAG TPA: DUF6510 family protein [Candidatus Deferrimicrobiaceae bacterium]|nr:DUF6510 family protein [Candidatus Deferrimicrobiaceae bacterium]